MPLRHLNSSIDSLKLVIQPSDLQAYHRLQKLGFLPVPGVPLLVYLLTNQKQLVSVFQQINRNLSEIEQSLSRYTITRSHLGSRNFLVEFLNAQPLSAITLSVRHAWFLQILTCQQLLFKYQPIFDLTSGKVVAYECLARAHNDQGQFFNGQQLMDAARSLNLTHEFDDLARTLCLASLGQFTSRSLDEAQPTFFINVLPNAILRDPQTLEQNLQQVQELGLNPRQIVFELTEVEALDSTGNLGHLVQQIRDWGFGVATDDLGSNVSIDNYFMDFQPDVIKLDHRLIHHCSRYSLKQVLVRSLVQTAHEFGITVLAEGLEHAEDVEFCQEMGVDLGQGFALAHPGFTLDHTININQRRVSKAS